MEQIEKDNVPSNSSHNIESVPQSGTGDLTTDSSLLPRFEIKKWNAVTMWSWNILTDTCAICRNPLNTPSIEYQANPSPANEPGLQIAFGSCGHVFHLDCIQRWRKTRSVCPLCNKEWEDSKYERIPGFSNLGI